VTRGLSIEVMHMDPATPWGTYLGSLVFHVLLQSRCMSRGT
jgi:hypothetical protein